MNISTAVIVAAGKGRRMGTEISKQFLPLCGKEILAHTVEKFEKAACIRDIILVTGEDALQDVRQMAQEYGWKKIISVTEGGRERQDSVFLGLQQVPQDTEIVLIHDGASVCDGGNSGTLHCGGKGDRRLCGRRACEGYD